MDEHADRHRHAACEHPGQQGEDGDHRDCDVLPHHADCALGQPDRLGQAQQVVAHERDVRGLHRHRRTGRAHRHPDIRRGQGGCIVDTVADHRHRVSLTLELGDSVELVLGQHAGPDLVDSGLRGDRLGHQLHVTGEHDDLLHARLVQPRDHLERVRTDCVRHRDDARDTGIHRNGHGGLALPRELVSGPLRGVVVVDPKFVQ